MHRLIPTDTTPLLTPSSSEHLLFSRSLLRHPLRVSASQLLRRASSRRMMLRETSNLVRENAAEQLEARQSEWAYSKPIVFLDVLWKLTLVASLCSVLGVSLEEKPNVPLRVWLVGYGLQCLCHVWCVLVEYRRRRVSFTRRWDGGDLESVSDGGDSVDYVAEQDITNEYHVGVAKNLESANTMLSYVWWVVGFYWVTAGGQNLIRDSPQLYWVCTIFLGFDVVFLIVCVAAASLVGIAICCCLPCIIGILYAMTDQDGATKEEIDRLPKYKFRRVGEPAKINGEVQEPFGGTMTECKSDSPNERSLSHDDAECCICLVDYEDGTELRELPCRHHFHCVCIDKWLKINAICPLCKLHILKPRNEI